MSGRTVGQWVSVLVVMEIKNLLRNTDLSIKEISTGLNFPSQSLMGRYFKTTPASLRSTIVDVDGRTLRAHFFSRHRTHYI